MKKRFIRGKIEINYGADNFCYIKSKNGKRVNLTEWMKKFDGEDVEIDVFAISEEGIKCPNRCNPIKLFEIGNNQFECKQCNEIFVNSEEVEDES